MILTEGITRHLAVGVVVVSALIMGFIIYELSITKQDFATQLIGQSSTQLQSDLDEFFMPIENMIMTLKRQQKNLFLQDFGAVTLNNYFIPTIDQYSQVSSIALSDSRGYEFNILPDTTSGIWLNREIHVDQWGMLEKWDSWSYQGDSLEHLQYWEKQLENDPRQRPWFLGAMNGTEIYWTEPYLYMTGELGLTASIEWHISSADTLRHVLAIDVTLKDLSRFSQKLQLTENNQNFILTSPNQNIIGLPQGYDSLNSKELSKKLMTPPEEFGHPSLIELLEYPVNQIVSFNSQNERWWGILKPYSISSSQELYLAVLIPESDFSSEIDSTRNAVIVGFIVILLLSLLLVGNHNKLRSLSQELKETNKIIEDQKQLLFTEVHHRVKNNLAIIAALIDIENMQSDNEAVNYMLSNTQKRIQAMSAVHEILYKTDNMNRVQVQDFIPEILNFHKNNNRELKASINGAFINVNQALTYALLLNEIMSTILSADHVQDEVVEVHVEKNEDTLITDIKVGTKVTVLDSDKGVEKQLIDVLLIQLDATFKTIDAGEIVHYQIIFKLQDKKGITSNQRV